MEGANYTAESPPSRLSLKSKKKKDKLSAVMWWFKKKKKRPQVFKHMRQKNGNINHNKLRFVKNIYFTLHFMTKKAQFIIYSDEY